MQYFMWLFVVNRNEKINFPLSYVPESKTAS